MSLDYGFNDKMEAGKAAAQHRRNRGESARSRGKWAKALPADDTAENRLHADLAAAYREIRERDNTIAVLRANGGAEPEPIDPWGAEFDRLSGKAQRQGLPPLPPLSPQSSTTPERTRGAATMTTRQYLAALKKLGLTPASRETADILGLSVRQCQRIAAGYPVPETLARLLAAYLQHGLPPRESA